MPNDPRPNDDELRSRMQRLAATHEVAELSADEVMARRSSTARRQRFLAVAAVLLLVVGVVGLVQLFTDDDGSIADVASDPEEPATEEAEGADSAGDDAVAVPTTVAASGGDVAAAASADIAYDGGGSWVVPWGDGFLSFGQVLEPSDATMADLVPDIADRLPVEVIEALGGVTDVQEATDLLDSVGLLDEATTAVMDDPELYAAYNQVISGGTYRSEASVSTDGVNWTVLTDFAPPGGGEYFNSVRSDGERLVILEQRWNETSDDSEILVHTTTDLVTWNSTPVPMPATDLPEFVNVEQYANDLAILDGGWYLTVGTSGWVDIWSLLPADVTAEFEDSHGWSVDTDGVRVSSGEMMYEDGAMSSGGLSVAEDTMADVAAADGATTTVPPVPGDDDGETSRLVPWSEIGISYDDYLRYSSGEPTTSQAFLGTWEGTLTPAAVPDAVSCCTIVGTEAGLLAQSWGTWDEQTGEQPGQLFFSADGQSWIGIDGPTGSALNSVAAVDGGVVAVDQSGTIWRAAADGTGWTVVEIAGLPEVAGIWFDQQTNGGVATVVDVAVYDHEYEQVPYVVTIEQDGFEVVTDYAADGSTALTVTDIDTGEVVLDRSFNQFESVMPDFLRFDGGDLALLDDDGEVIVTVAMETFEQETSAALQAAQEAAGWVEPEYLYEPDFWVVATSDGITWYVEDLVDTEDAGFGQAAINGNLVVVRDWEGGWETITIG